MSNKLWNIFIIFLLSACATMPRASEEYFSKDQQIDSHLAKSFDYLLPLMKRRELPLDFTKRITVAKVVSKAEFMKKFTTFKYNEKNQAMTIFFQDGTIEMYFSEELLGKDNQMHPFVLHELLHILSYDHPKKECEWSAPNCGVMGGPMNRYFSPFEAHDIIQKSLRPKYLNSLPRHK